MLYETSSFDARGGRDAMDRLLAACPEIDGVVCATDTMAMGALAALRETGRNVPEDVSLVGVGDDWIDEISTPALTTAHLFFHRCGEEAAGLLLELLGNDGDLQKLAEPQIRLPYLIVERGSV
jgi:LacI family sucrose operon transcriptional repressor